MTTLPLNSSDAPDCENASRDALLSADERRLLDQRCDAFEQQWQQHRWPRLEEFLTGDQALRAALLEELLKIDRHWRQVAADARQLNKSYQARFPQDAVIVDHVWELPAEDRSSLGVQQTSLGPFDDLELIGEGGFGVVFRAHDSRHGRLVALKISRFGFAPESRDLKRFLREAQAAGSLDHPHIARVWDSGTVAGVTYIAYQFVEGENLKERMHEVAGQSPQIVAEFVATLARAVQYAHDQGVVHRDIKPSNVLLTTDNRPILTDFGLALATGGDATRSLAACVGTLDYMSPEQAAGRSDEVDGRADLWSLGVIAYELLTGQKPFQAESDAQLRMKIAQSDPRRPRHLRGSIPRDLEVLTIRCLQKRPDDRLASCGLLADELDRYARGQPIVSRPVSTVERTWRWCRRNPRPVTAFAAILAATTFGAWSWGLRVTDNRENENVVQQLQIDLELERIGRRELLDDFTAGNPAEMRLREADVRHLESALFGAGDLDERLAVAKLLLEQSRLTTADYRNAPTRRAELVNILQQLLDTETDERIREQARATLNALRE